MTDTKYDRLQEVGKGAMSSLREMVAALECDYERLQELRDERDGNDEHDDQCGQSGNWALDNPDDAEELKDLEAAANCNGQPCEDREDAERRIHEDPLSIQVRDGWRDLGAESDGAEEFEILLATGGPAVRILGELQSGEVHRAWLQVQDWGTPWTDYYEEGCSEVIEAYCRCFCFEE